ncbi:hypothetical protein JFL43_21880 [Viridibacillus sp. YIM B01967]|uniref:Beta-carotene 15,15'-monooxygenase n=1 Tax=Viridibacillus soli TaxID=2798301 RepID=A0ABS1HE86_9BACL|nr:hypothetical protein [Viridibacillus soli]MBK3497412.1 hypothetical protein [Viridibacillus soli]
MISERQLATILWGMIIVVGLLCFSKQKRYLFKSLSDLIKAFYKVLTQKFALYIHIYVLCMLITLQYISLLSAETLIAYFIWIVTVLYPSIFNAISANKKPYKVSLVKQQLGINILFLFIVSNYTFNFWIEFLILLPIITFLSMLSVVSSIKEEHQSVKKLTNFLLGGIGLFILFYAIGEFVDNFKDIKDVEFWRNLAIEVYIILHLPIIYFAKLYGYYEEYKVILKIKFRSNEEKKIKITCIRIMFILKFNETKMKNGLKLIRKTKYSGLNEIIESFKNSNLEYTEMENN